MIRGCFCQTADFNRRFFSCIAGKGNCTGYAALIQTAAFSGYQTTGIYFVNISVKYDVTCHFTGSKHTLRGVESSDTACDNLAPVTQSPCTAECSNGAGKTAVGDGTKV